MAPSEQRGAPPRAAIRAPRVALCLDFTNTVAWRASAPKDSLASLTDVVGWCVESAALPESIAHTYRALARSDPSAEPFNSAIALREALYRIFYRVAQGRVPCVSDLRLLNAELQRAPMRTRLERTNDGFCWLVERARPSAALMLAPVLWSAADLLVGPALARVRPCANDRCRWLFLDESKNGTRRWCSMESCGNRAKAHRHYHRRKRNRTARRESLATR